jgi:fatty-acyl-CoA synthase
MHLDESLRPRPANFVPLTPVDFLRRSVEVFPQRAAVRHGERTLSYEDLGALVGRIAGALKRDGVGKGDVVSVLAANRPEMLAMHFAVPMIGAVLNAINTRLDAGAIGYILTHAETRLLFAEAALRDLAVAAMQGAASIPLVRLGEAAESPGAFERWLGDAPAEPIALDAIADEWQPIALNYTSGTTGRPKGVVYHHRGAWLNAIGNLVALGFEASTAYLWTLPMFHCNGWCHPWAVTAAGGKHVCLDRIDAGEIFRLIEAEEITHFACAPVVLYMLLNHPDRRLRDARRRVKVATGGAAPTPTLIEGLDALGFDLTHLYGLTECYGPATLCALRDDWDAPDGNARARLLARQGVRHVAAAEIGVAAEDGGAVPDDARTMGEIVMRSNTLMAGYYKDAAATEKAFAGGVFHTGDLAVRHADGYVEIRDRAKDIIISGGENISSLEVESVLHQHPAVMLAAVVALADEKWGEAPVACIELKPGVDRPTEEALIAFCRARLAGFKAPRRILFRELPKTATGKIQKFQLRAELAGESG